MLGSLPALLGKKHLLSCVARETLVKVGFPRVGCNSIHGLTLLERVREGIQWVTTQESAFPFLLLQHRALALLLLQHRALAFDVVVLC